MTQKNFSSAVEFKKEWATLVTVKLMQIKCMVGESNKANCVNNDNIKRKTHEGHRTACYT